MKKIILILGLVALCNYSYSQTNVLNSTGNVGVGTTSPDTKLHVSGNLKVDSCIIVSDSLIVDKSIHTKSDMLIDGEAMIKGDTEIEEDLQVDGVTKMMGTTKMLGNVRMESLQTAGTGAINNSNLNFLMVNPNGLLREGDINMLREHLLLNMYLDDDPNFLCDGGAVVQNPIWNNGPNKLYSKCPQVNVGIGTASPQNSLDVRGDAYFQNNIGIGVTPNPLAQILSATSKEVGFCIDHNYSGDYGYAMKALVDKDLTKGIGIFNETYGKDIFTVYGDGKIEVSNASGKILQLENNGLLRGRQIKLDLDNWADFVFDEDYKLMPLSEVETFITKENHLPNVPSEKELIADGLDLEEMNKILMMKVEELTLYLIEQNKSIDELTTKVTELENKK